MKIVKSLLSFIVMFGTLFTFTANSDAATPKTMNAKVANSVYVHAQPSANAKNVGTLWKGTKVVVYSKSKTGWAKIKFNKKTAYVYASYLTFSKNTTKKATTTKTTTKAKKTTTSKKATAKKTASKSTSKDSKKITYRPVVTNTYYYVENGKNGKLYSTGKRNSTGWTYWYKKTGSKDKQSFLVKESAKGLDYKFKTGTVRQIVYPFTKGQVFKVNNKKYKIVSISNTFKVKAGTFKSVVGIKAADGSITYYAPNAGAIKTIKNKKVIYEITKIKTK